LPRKPRVAHRLEGLEDRVVLSPFVVSNTLDNAPGQPLIPGSLRWAVVQSDNTPGSNEIDFDPGLSGTITLTGGQLTIANNAVSILGPGANVLSVSGNNHSRVFEVDAVAATFDGLTIIGGHGQDGGGGIYNNAGEVTVTDSAIGGNSASGSGIGYGYGGGIYNTGTLTVTDSAIGGNSASASGGGSGFGGGVGYGYGGGIYNTGAVTIADGMISGNSASGFNSGYGRGGGIYNYGGLVALAGVTIGGGNSAGDDGGGICNDGGGVAIAGCTIWHNSAKRGGGIVNPGGVMVIVASDVGDDVFGDVFLLT
jgi:hypothetical protein